MATAEAEHAAPSTGHVPWRRRLLVLVLAVLGVVTAVHVFGGVHTSMGAAAIGGLVLLGFVIWRLPHLRKHFAKPGNGSLNYPGQHGLPKPFRRSGGARLTSGGTGRRHRLALPGGSRKTGSGSGRKTGAGPGRKTGSLMRPRRPGASRPVRPAGSRRGGAGTKTPFRGRSRAGSRPGGSSRGRSRTGGLIRPRRPGTGRASRRQGGAGSGRRRILPVSRGSGAARRATGTPGRTGTRRRILPWRRNRPATGTPPRTRSRVMPWRRNRPATGTPPRTRPASTGPKPSWRHPVARARWRRAQSSRTMPPWRRKARHRWNRVQLRARRGWNIMLGRPGGQLSRQPGMNRVRRAWRVRHGRTVPGGWTAAEQQRYRRRSARRRLPRQQRIKLRLAWAMSWRRGHRPPPKPLARSGRHGTGWRWANRLLARFDRRRMRRWVRARRRGRPAAAPVTRRPPVLPVPVPKPGPVHPVVVDPSSNGHRPSSSRGGAVADTAAIADQIREMGGHEFDDPDDVHKTLTGMHELIAANEEVLRRWGEALAETGVHPRYAEAVAEAAAAMSGIAEELEAVTAGGVMRGPGG